MKKKTKKMTKKTILISIVLIVAIYGIIMIATNRKITINFEKEKKMIVKYNTMQFKAETDDDGNSVLRGKDESISFSKTKNLDNYSNDYIILRDYRVMAYNGKLVNYNGTEYAVYKKENNYELLCQIGTDGYMEIKISSSQDSIEDVFNSKKVQKVLSKMELK